MSTTAKQLTRIVAGVDGSDAAHSVVERALDAANRFDIDEVHFLRVVGKRSDENIDTAHAELTEIVREKMADFALSSDDEAHHKRRARVHVAKGKPAEEILQLAGDLQAKLIVIGRHGDAGRLRDKFGTVPSRIIRDATCSVLVEQPIEYVAQPEVTCDACVEVRRESDGDRWFCDGHADGHEWKSSMLIAASFTSLRGVY